MKLATVINHSGDPRQTAAQVVELEKAGIDQIWVPELYGFDAVSLMGYLAAQTDRAEIASGILPIYSRTPALIAQTAAGLDALTDGRFILGLGTSGPQVIEGWHGVAFDQPVARTREIIEICRKAWRRDVVEHVGAAYQLPLPEDRGTGLGKPLKLINHPERANIPIYVASLGPKNVEMTAEMADGWLPIFYVPEKAADVWGGDLASGGANRSSDLGELDVVVAGGMVAIGDDEVTTKVRDTARGMASFYVGGMGAKGKNFYNTLFKRYGWEEAAEKIQDEFLAGHRDDSAAAIPEEFLDLTVLAGDEGAVRDRVLAYKASGATVLQFTPFGDNAAETIDKLRSWVD